MIALVNDKWEGTIGANHGKPSPKEVKVLKAFDDLVKDGKATQRASGHWAIKHDDWEKECRRRGCGLVQLAMNKSREDTLRFYESLGFTATHEGLKLPL